MDAIAQFQLMFIGLGAMFVLLGIPLAMKLVRPNSTYGYRIQETLNDERIWYLANSFSGKGMIFCGVITAIFAKVLYAPAVSFTSYTLECTAVMLGSLLLTLVATRIYISRIS